MRITAAIAAVSIGAALGLAACGGTDDGEQEKERPGVTHDYDECGNEAAQEIDKAVNRGVLLPPPNKAERNEWQQAILDRIEDECVTPETELEGKNPKKVAGKVARSGSRSPQTAG